MKKLGKIVTGMIGSLLFLGGFVKVSVKSEEIEPPFENKVKKNIFLTFNDNVAICILSIIGKRFTSKITGAIKLYDETDKKTVQIWQVVERSPIYSVSKMAEVKAGHTYTMSFIGNAYDTSGGDEVITVLTTATNNL